MFISPTAPVPDHDSITRAVAKAEAATKAAAFREKIATTGLPKKITWARIQLWDRWSDPQQAGKKGIARFNLKIEATNVDPYYVTRVSKGKIIRYAELSTYKQFRDNCKRKKLEGDERETADVLLQLMKERDADYPDAPRSLAGFVARKVVGHGTARYHNQMAHVLWKRTGSVWIPVVQLVIEDDTDVDCELKPVEGAAGSASFASQYISPELRKHIDGLKARKDTRAGAAS